MRKLSLEDFASLIWTSIDRLRLRGYFTEALARHSAPDGTDLPPRIEHAEAVFLRRLRTTGIYEKVTPPTKILAYSNSTPAPWMFDADVLFDTLEFLYTEVVAEPAKRPDGPTVYNREDGRRVLRETINPDLGLFDPPMEMLDNGQIVQTAPDDLRPLLDDPIPDDVPAPLRDPLREAIEQYRRRGASDHDKRSALKHLADVLEPLRGEIDEYILPGDESALFQVANKFWIRHNDRIQQRNYDAAVWLDWIFYVYVATARALLAVLDRQRLSTAVYGEEPDSKGGLPL